MNKKDISDVQIFARTIYGEARGEYKKYGRQALEAVGLVIMNRSKQRKQTITKVCLQPYQFSCWNEGDPNKEKILSVTTADKTFIVCLEVAGDLIGGKISDFLNGANHYYSDTMKEPPYWAKGQKPVAKVGHHIFFKL